MNAKYKINLSEYLKMLNNRLFTYNAYKSADCKLNIEPLSCKTLAEKILVTPATLSNLTTCSKFSLIDDIACELSFHYFDLYLIWDKGWFSDDDKPFEHHPAMIIWELSHHYIEKL